MFDKSIIPSLIMSCYLPKKDDAIGKSYIELWTYRQLESCDLNSKNNAHTGNKYNKNTDTFFPT